jgi:hypothetical protein
MTHGLLPFAFSTGIMFSTTFLKMLFGVTVTFPPKWNRPLLLNGSEVVPSNSSKRTELFPSKSKTNPSTLSAFASTFFFNFSMLSGEATQPGVVMP